MTADTGPLAGIRVLDLSRILAAPVAKQLTGKLGADLIKIGHPRFGEPPEEVLQEISRFSRKPSDRGCAPTA
jgi:crotonobetainyl-CoA:carnitine CoA-transferase CaiB-like acyl-CoA transferase